METKDKLNEEYELLWGNYDTLEEAKSAAVEYTKKTGQLTEIKKIVGPEGVEPFFIIDINENVLVEKVDFDFAKQIKGIVTPHFDQLEKARKILKRTWLGKTVELNRQAKFVNVTDVAFTYKQDAVTKQYVPGLQIVAKKSFIKPPGDTQWKPLTKPASAIQLMKIGKVELTNADEEAAEEKAGNDDGEVAGTPVVK